MQKKIYASALSPFSARLRISCAFKGLDYVFETPPGGSGSAELKKITPFGRIPVLVDDDTGTVLVESLALLDYLEDAYPETRSLRPEAARSRARVRMIGQLFDLNVMKAFSGVFAQMAKPTPDVNAARAALDDVEAELAKLVYFFDVQGPAVGGQWSMADCAMAPFAFLMDALAPAFGAISPTQRVPRFEQWWAEASRVPEIESVTAGMQRALSAMMAARKAQVAS